jgi:hypothetical protein
MAVTKKISRHTFGPIMMSFDGTFFHAKSLFFAPTNALVKNDYLHRHLMVLTAQLAAALAGDRKVDAPARG